MSLVYFILQPSPPHTCLFFSPTPLNFYFSPLRNLSYRVSHILDLACWFPVMVSDLLPWPPCSQRGWELDLGQLMVRHRLIIWQKHSGSHVVYILLHLVHRHRYPGSHCKWSYDWSLQSGVRPPCYIAYQTPTYWSEHPLMTVALSCDFINRCHMVIF